MDKLSDLKKDIRKLANPERAQHSLRFFKTGKGEYGEGDIFLGLNNPQQRSLVKKYKYLSLPDLQKLLDSRYHEERQIALFIMDLQFKKNKENIYKLYCKNTKRINNWDLVDCSAPHITGVYLLDHERKILYQWAKSKNLWEKRIAMMSCFAFIRNKDYIDALKLAEIFLHDPHDLMHKAVGWMLREIGNRDLAVEENFLQKYYKQMPRTMLRYAIEKFPEQKRKGYLEK